MDRTTLILRLALLVSVALAISGARLPVGRASTPALEVRDISASMGRGATRSGTTGGGAWLAVADGVRQVPAGAGVEGLSRAASTLGAGLAEAARSWPGRDVVLTSDGRATDDALAGVEAVAAAGGRVFTRPPETPSADVALLSARLVRGGAGTPVRVIARVASSTQGRGRLVLSRQGRTVGSTEIVFAADTSQTLVLEDPDVPSEAVGYLLRLALAPGTPDDDPGNDELALGLAPERPSVRVWGELDLEALRGSEPGLEVTRLPAAGAADLGAADLVVVAGLPWSSIGPEGAEALARFVAEGGRLLLLGGPTAYAPGGWGGTLLERSLAPLRVRRPPEGSVAIVVALDVSGSTSGAPLAALKQAAREALDALQPGERLAVLPFRGATGASPLEPGFVAAHDVEGAARLEAAIEALWASGPTDLPGAVAAGVTLLESAQGAQQRRLLLLTDGDPDERPDAARLAALAPRLSSARVRLGALVVGMPEAAEALRKGLAERPEDVRLLAGGESLAPELLAQLARQRARAEAERLGSPLGLEALPGTWATLLAPEGPWTWVHDVEAADGAEVLARARLASPWGSLSAFAAERAHGAGRVHGLAWGPGAEADPLAATRRLAPLVAQLARAADRGVSAEIDVRGRLGVALPEQQGRGRLTLVMGEVTVALLEVAPGWFGSERALPDVTHAYVRGPGFERVLRLPARPPLEHRGAGVERARLVALAAAGGGRLLVPGEEPPRAQSGPGLALAPLFLLLAAILLGVERWRAWRAPAAAAEEPT